MASPRHGGGGGGGRSDTAPSSAAASPPPAVTNTTIPSKLWKLSVPVYITHASSSASASSALPFVASVPRFGYLAFLLPRLAAYFGKPCSSFHHEDVQLRNLPAGLLVDLYRPQSLPWRLVVDEGEEWHIGDTFLNGAKEVCVFVPFRFIFSSW
jgi:autophagy-related protein 5